MRKRTRDNFPRLVATRSGNVITFTVSNLRDRELAFFKAPNEKSNYVLVDRYVESDFPFTETLATGERPKYAASIPSLGDSVIIIEENTTTEPFYIEFEPIPPTNVTTSSSTISVSWGADITYDLYNINDFKLGTLIPSKYT